LDYRDRREAQQDEQKEVLSAKLLKNSFHHVLWLLKVLLVIDELISPGNHEQGWQLIEGQSLDISSQIGLSISLNILFVNILGGRALLTKIETEHIFGPIEEITLKEVLVLTILITSDELVYLFLKNFVFFKKLVVFEANLFSLSDGLSSLRTCETLCLSPKFPLFLSHSDSPWMTMVVNAVEHAKMRTLDPKIQTELFDASPNSLIPIENKDHELEEPKVHQTCLILRKIN
jgi:hypothetical protein